MDNIQKAALAFLALSMLVIVFITSKDSAEISANATTTEVVTEATTEETTQEVTETTTEIITTTEPTTKEHTTVVNTTKAPETTKSVTTTKATTAPAKTSSSGYSIPDNGGKFKSYTNYKLLSRSSPQWTRIQCNENAYTDENGLRKVGDYYCAAMGSYYSTTLGDLFRITTENGSFEIILCDFKADAHTDSTHRYTLCNGCMVEFYVDMSCLNSRVNQMGDCSYANSSFMGRITKVEKIGNYFN